MFKTLIT